MTDARANERLLIAGNLPAYFHDSLAGAMQRRAVDSDDATKWYLANMLARYSRSDQFFDFSQEDGLDLRPLALLYGDAMHASSERERRLSFQRMGDLALIVSALFEGIIKRRGVKRDYFFSMGCGAYAYLAAHPAPGGEPIVFDDLARRFALFVDVLAMVGSDGKRFDEKEIVGLYRHWQDTGSPQAEQQLRALGVHLEPLGRSH